MPDVNKLPHGKPLLAVAHPGHELRVYHWIERARPDVLILTDGSGHKGRSRLERSIELLAGVGAQTTKFCGVVPDTRLYAALLDGELSMFVDTARRIAEVIERGKYDYVVGDAAEGLILGHDIFRAMLDTAIEAVRRDSQRRILNLDFPLEAPPCSVHPAIAEATYRFELSDAAIERKLAAGMAYTELVHEVEAAVAAQGRDAFRVECLRPAITESGFAPFVGRPAYETHGAQVVAEGRYQNVVRYAEHVRPVIAALRAAFLLPAERPVAAA